MSKYLETGSPETQWCRIHAQIMVLQRRLKDASKLASKKRREGYPKCPSCGSNCYVIKYVVSFSPGHDGWDCECICDERFSAQYFAISVPEDDKITEIEDQIKDLSKKLEELKPVLSVS